MTGPPTRVVGRRVAAWVIDLVPTVVLYVAAVATFGREVSTVSGSGSAVQFSFTINDTLYLADGANGNKVLVAVLAFGLLNQVLLQGLTGGTVGKLLVGLRVVRPDGRVCGVQKAAVRWVVLVVDAFPYIAPVVAFVLALNTRGNRRLGDMAADTYVVRAADAGRPVVLDAPGQQAESPPGAPQWDGQRQTWVRWDGYAWTQHDSTTDRWQPIR